MGSGFCKHGYRKTLCKICGGNGICKHKFQKRSCSICGIKCASCQLSVVKNINSKCGHCLPIAKHRSRCKEARVAASLGDWASSDLIPLYTSWNKTIPDISKAVCGGYRPDFVWDMQFRAIVLEVDEYQHKYWSYELRCELVRVSRIVESHGGIPVHIIRYNPDAFKINNVTRPTKLGERLALLQAKLREAFDRPDFENRIVVQHLFFDQDGDTNEFVTTQRYKTLEEYEQWVDTTAPIKTMGGTHVPALMSSGSPED